jgi:hypothetical protein
VRKELEGDGYSCVLWEDKQRGVKLQNLCVGSLQKAKKIIVAGYDTPSKVFRKDYKYYPLNYVKNQENDKKELTIKVLISFFLITIGVVLLFFYSDFSPALRVITIIANVVSLLFSILFLRGFGNLFNFNKNTGAVAIAYELIKKFGPRREDVVVLFLDRVATSSIGFAYLSKLINNLEGSKEVLILDCVAVGEKTFFASDRRDCTHVDKIARFYEGEEKELYLVPNEEVKRTPLSFFTKALLITCGELEDTDVVVKHTRSDADINFDLVTMEKIRDCVYQYCSE